MRTRGSDAVRAMVDAAGAMEAEDFVGNDGMAAGVSEESGATGLRAEIANLLAGATATAAMIGEVRAAIGAIAADFAEGTIAIAGRDLKLRPRWRD